MEYTTPTATMFWLNQKCSQAWRMDVLRLVVLYAALAQSTCRAQASCRAQPAQPTWQPPAEAARSTSRS